MNSFAQPDWARIARARWPLREVRGAGPYAAIVGQSIRLFQSWDAMRAEFPAGSTWVKLKENPAERYVRKAHWAKMIELEG